MAAPWRPTSRRSSSAVLWLEPPNPRPDLPPAACLAGFGVSARITRQLGRRERFGMDSFNDKRVSPRIPAKIPVLIDGHAADMNPIREQSYTLLINESGALIALSANFRLNERVRITNTRTGKQTDGRMAWRSAEPLDGRWSYGIALI